MSNKNSSGKTFTHFRDHQKLDQFIQASLDKFFFVQPWQELYDNSVPFSKHIISNKSTIPDLIIYNKSFDLPLSEEMQKNLSSPPLFNIIIEYIIYNSFLNNQVNFLQAKEIINDIYKLNIDLADESLSAETKEFRKKRFENKLIGIELDPKFDCVK